MDTIQKELLEAVADLHEIPQGAYNIRANGASAGRNSTEHIEITSKEEVPGIDIRVKEGTVKESLHIPVLLSQSGIEDVVYNDFYIEDNCDVLIVAGCGIHNAGDQKTRHDGIHRFFVGKNSKIRYVEKHYGQGEGTGERIMNPVTEVELGEGSEMEMETVQIKGVDSTVRVTKAVLEKGAKLVVTERLMTHGDQRAESEFQVDLNGEDSSANIVSRAVARDRSYQLFRSIINGNAKCSGHSECDSIIMDHANISAVPEITANHTDAALIHEAAIGKIAGDQIIKLMTLGLSEKEAEEEIVNGFLK